MHSYKSSRSLPEDFFIMCLNPILIKNVNYGNKSKLSHISDTTSQYIPVPCGRCSVCLALKQQYIVQRVQMESLSHDLYFGTLTYNNESLPIHEVGDFRLAYVDICDWQKMLKMIRKHEHLPNFKYLFVTEFGGRRHRPHIHFILSFPKIESQTLAEKRSFEILLLISSLSIGVVILQIILFGEVNQFLISVLLYGCLYVLMFVIVNLIITIFTI